MAERQQLEQKLRLQRVELAKGAGALQVGKRGKVAERRAATHQPPPPRQLVPDSLAPLHCFVYTSVPSVGSVPRLVTRLTRTAPSAGCTQPTPLLSFPLSVCRGPRPRRAARGAGHHAAERDGHRGGGAAAAGGGPGGVPGAAWEEAVWRGGEAGREGEGRRGVESVTAERQNNVRLGGP